MSSVLFFDHSCPSPYDASNLRSGGLGGTEATIIRIAEALDAEVMQHNRRAPSGRYLPPSSRPDIEHVMLLRDPRRFRSLRELFPRARFYLWVHDLINPGSKETRRFSAAADVLRELDVTTVCVSDFQQRQLQDALGRIRGCESLKTVRIYNPIDDGLQPDDTAVDRDRLIFFSSPHKGLAYALDVFRELKRRIPQLRLQVSNPGYIATRAAVIEGVEWLGARPQEQVLRQVRSALCTFFPNFVVPETFGLVLAESNAVGTPVLTHDCGAAAEVLHDVRQVMPVRSGYRGYEAFAQRLPLNWRAAPARLAARIGLFDQYVERIEAWREGERPQTGPDARFRLSTVSAQWRQLFA